MCRVAPEGRPPPPAPLLLRFAKQNGRGKTAEHPEAPGPGTLTQYLRAGGFVRLAAHRRRARGRARGPPRTPEEC